MKKIKRLHFPVGGSCGALLFIWGILINPGSPQIPPGNIAFSLDAWLQAHPKVQQSIIWNFPPPESSGQTPGPRQPPLGSGGFQSSIGLNTSQPDCVGTGSCPIYPTIPDLPGSDQSRNLTWDQWPEDYKKIVRDNFTAYSKWLKDFPAMYQEYAASNYTVKPVDFVERFPYHADPDPNPIQDPPIDLQPMGITGGYVQIVSPHAAFNLYAKLIAFQLAWDIGKYRNWRLDDLGPESLATLFDGRNIFIYVEPGQTLLGLSQVSGYLLTSGVIPAPPLVAFNFLVQEGILRPTRRETVVQFLDWERNNLLHFVPGEPHADCPKKTGFEVYWNYNGHAVPASAVIRGVDMACPLYNDNGNGNGAKIYYPGVRHWYGGCSGAANFNEQVLRVINLPAAAKSFGHFQSSFIIEPQSTIRSPLWGNDSEAGRLPNLKSSYQDGPHNSRVWLDHTDNPPGVSDSPEIPSERLLVDEKTFWQWFDEINPNWPKEKSDVVRDQNLKSVARRPTDLRIEYLPISMLVVYCENDQNVASLADSRVYDNYFQSANPENTLYSPADLEQMHFWENLLAKVEALGGCNAILQQYGAQY